MQYAPNTTYVIGRHIPDPSDTSTYYVRAYVFDAKTFTLLETLDLDDQGNGTHTKEYRLPADVSGQGRQLLVKTTVFTDSGHTTKSELYAEELESDVLVKAFNNLGGGGYGGTDIDYSKIENILRTVLEEHHKKMMKHMEDNKEEPVDISHMEEGLQNALESILDAISAIPTNKTEKVSLEPILKQIEGVRKEISSKIDKTDKTISDEFNKKGDLISKILDLFKKKSEEKESKKEEKTDKLDEANKIADILIGYFEEKGKKEKKKEDEIKKIKSLMD